MPGVVKKIVGKVKDAASDVKDKVESHLVANEVRVWPTPEGYCRDYPESAIREIAAKKDVGVCFSGGGTRSASCSLGQMRALRAIRIDGRPAIDHVKYISCISGGSWFAVPYTYLPRTTSDDTFLGRHLEPVDCTFAALRAMSDSNNTFANTISQSQMVTRVLRNYFSARLKKLPLVDWGSIDETYSRAVGETFLKPFGLGEGFGKLPRFFTWRADQLNAILRRNPHVEENDFYCVTQATRPFLIAGMTMMAPHPKTTKFNALQLPAIPKSAWPSINRIAQSWPYMVHFEGTPLYVGATVPHKVGLLNKNVGGGYAEPLAFDTHAPLLAPGKDHLVKSRVGSIHHRFTLADLIGTCGAAPAIATHFANEGADGESLAGIFPRFRHWPVKEKGIVTEGEFNFGDGGYIDSYGIIPLLKRKVRTIICFINTDKPLIGRPGDKDFAIDGDLPWLFGATKYVSELLPGVFMRNKGQVFQDDVQNTAFLRTVKGLVTMRDASADGANNIIAESQGKGDRAVFHSDTYRVLSNPYLGVEGGWDVNVVWFYNSRRKKAWELRLPQAVRDSIENDRDKDARTLFSLKDDTSFSRFPHYRTGMENGLHFNWDNDAPWGAKLEAFEPTDLTKEQVSLLAHLSSWAVLDARAELERLFARA